MDLYITKRRKTITNFDSSDHNKTVEDRYSTYIESAKVPITTVFKAPPPTSTYSEIIDGSVEGDDRLLPALSPLDHPENVWQRKTRKMSQSAQDRSLARMSQKNRRAGAVP